MAVNSTEAAFTSSQERARGPRFHRGKKLEPAGKAAAPRHAHDRDVTVLERLPERLERGPLELRHLVEKEDALVREAHLAGPRHPSAATPDQGGYRRGMVRRPERRHPDETGSRRKNA